MTKLGSRFSVALFFLIIIFGGVFRFWQLRSLPAVIHRDEAAIGYNAYSLLLTGRDEHNQGWPINFRSFGDFKLPGLIYTSIPVIKFLGLNSLAVRLPTAFFALATIPAVYWLSRRLGWSKEISLLSMAIIAFDFWHIAQARNAYEPIAGLFFSSLAWASWLSADKSKGWYVVSLLFYLIGSAFYNLPFLLLPLLLIGSWLIKNYSNNKWIRPWKIKGFKAVVALVVLIFSLSFLYGEVNSNKTATTIFSNPDLINISREVTFSSLVSGTPSLFTRIINHQWLFSLLRFAQGYLAAFDPTYLFFLGDHNSWHNLRSIGLGNSNPVLLIPFLVGIYVLLQSLDQRKSQLTLLYLLLSPLVSALTIDSPITNRLLDFHLAMTLVSAVGIVQLYKKFWFKKNIKLRLIFSVGVLAYLSFFIIFITRYFFTYNKLLTYAWNPGVVEMIEKTSQVANQYDWVFVTPDLEISYIYFAFYTPFNPAVFQAEAKWYKSGFEQVGEYRRYRFANFPAWSQITTDNVEKLFDNKYASILVVKRGKPGGNQETSWSQKDWKGRPTWYAWETNLDEAVSVLEKLPQNADRQRVLEYLYSCQTNMCMKTLLSES